LLYIKERPLEERLIFRTGEYINVFANPKETEMKHRLLSLFFAVAVFFISGTPSLFSGESKSSGPYDTLVISGTIKNLQGKGVKEAALSFFLNDEEVELEKEITTSPDGTYKAELSLPAGSLCQGRRSPLKSRSLPMKAPDG
jgi:hypothetical protein